MTRKDYILIATALVAARSFCETDNQRRGAENIEANEYEFTEDGERA